MGAVARALEALDQEKTLGSSRRRAVLALDALGDGVYLWGPAGRVKTWLLQLTDLDDTWMVERLLTALHGRGIALVATSNQASEDLLPVDDQHHLAAPTIERVRRHLTGCLVDDGIDHRTGTPAADSAFARGRVVRPGQPAWEAAQRSWVLSDDVGASNGGRALPFRSSPDGGVVDFLELRCTDRSTGQRGGAPRRAGSHRGPSDGPAHRRAAPALRRSSWTWPVSSPYR